MNPDAFIVRTNLHRPAAERPFDAKYALTLGADAVPPLLEALPNLDAPSQCEIATKLLHRWASNAAGAPDWRSWNWGRSRARRLVAERADALRAVPCAAAPNNSSLE